MKRLLPGFLILALFLSACGTVSVKVNWNPDQTPPGETATPLAIVAPLETATATAYVTPDLTATLLSALLTPSPTATAFVPRDPPQPDFTATPTAVAAIVPGAPLAFIRDQRAHWIAPNGLISPISDSAYTASAPLLSPDNRLVAYLEYRGRMMDGGDYLKDVVIASTDYAFEPRVLVNDSLYQLLSFSPDGQWLLAEHQVYMKGTYELHIIDVLSGEARAVVAPLGAPLETAYNVIWSPDSQTIFFDTKPVQDILPPRLELRAVDIKTGDVHFLLPTQQSGNLAFSPDSRKLLVAGIDGLFLFDLQNLSSAPQVLMTYKLPQIGFLLYALPQARWVENTDLIRLALPTEQDGESLLVFWEISTTNLTKIRLASYRNTRATKEILYDIPEFPRNKMHNLWTSDMQRVALNINVYFGGVERSDILMANEFGQNPVEFLHNARFVSWSPDGLHFLFISGREENVVQARQPFDLMLGRADNAGDSRTVLSGFEAALLLDTVRWLDGQTYVFQASGPDGGVQLWRGVIGGPPTRLN